MALVVQISFAQEKSISGTVSDNNGLPLPGATVIIQGTSSGVTTDFDGKYSISASQGDVLVFSYVGYANQPQVVGASSTINVSMVPDNALDEIVVEAYRTTSKETSSIASTTVTAETIESRPNASFAQTLQGQVAGLNIVTNTGQPGGNSLINLRGVSSISGNTEPLFIIDGVPVDEDNFRSLNPNDIASLSVLKDAGATSIYGNRGANGVIIIKTKRGSYDQDLKVTYAGITSFSNLQDHDYDLMNSREQLQLEKDYGAGFGATLSDVELEERALQANTDWLDVFFKTGITQSHTLSFSSGGKNLNSFTSLGFNDTEGILSEASTLKRFNLRNNLNGKSNDGRFRYSTALSLNYSESNEANFIGSGAINRNYVLGALLSVPYISPYSYVSGQGANIPVVFANTPLFLLDRLETYTRREDEIKIIASLKASYDITDNLTFNTSFGADFTDEQLLRSEAPNSFNAQLFAQTGNTTPGFEDRDSNRSIFLNFNNSLNYRNTFNEKHTLDVSVFSEYFKAHWRSFGFRQEGFDPGIKDSTLDLQLSYVDFLLDNLNKQDDAANFLKDNLKVKMSKINLAKIKIKLADILLRQEQFNRALVFYTQAQSQIKNSSLAQEARFKAAKTSYFKGDFEWAEAQLKVLKSSTSQLIANDALELHLMITDHKLGDSLQSALRIYSRADMLRLQKRPSKAINLLDTLITTYPNNPIVDQALLLQGRLMEKNGNYLGAIEKYQNLIHDFSTEILADDAYFDLAELYRTVLNMPQKAKDCYEKVIFDYQDSIHVVESTKHYRNLKSK